MSHRTLVWLWFSGVPKDMFAGQCKTSLLLLSTRSSSLYTAFASPAQQLPTLADFCVRNGLDLVVRSHQCRAYCIFSKISRLDQVSGILFCSRHDCHHDPASLSLAT